MFNADELARALALPRFRWQGRTYTGRLLGFTDAVALEARLNAMAEDADLAAVKTVAGEMLAVLQFTDDATGEPMAPDALFSLPGPLLLPALRDFLVPQGDTTGQAADPVPALMDPTPGNNSPGGDGVEPKQKRSRRNP